MKFMVMSVASRRAPIITMAHHHCCTEHISLLLFASTSTFVLVFFSDSLHRHHHWREHPFLDCITLYVRAHHREHLSWTDVDVDVDVDVDATLAVGYLSAIADSHLPHCQPSSVQLSK